MPLGKAASVLPIPRGAELHCWLARVTFQEVSVAMKKIDTEVQTILEAKSFKLHSVDDVAAAEGCEVDRYEKLVDLVAEMAWCRTRDGT